MLHAPSISLRVRNSTENSNQWHVLLKRKCKRLFLLSSIISRLVFIVYVFVYLHLNQIIMWVEFPCFDYLTEFITMFQMVGHTLALFRMGFFGAAHGWGGAQKAFPTPTLKSVSHILQRQNVAQLYLAWRRSKNIWITWHTPWVLLIFTFFHRKSASFAISRNTDEDSILIHDF